MLEEERMAAYLHSLDQPLSEPLSMLYQRAVEEEVPVIRPSTQSLLKYLMIAHHPKHILEVGCAVGFSALLMAETAGESVQITTIEKVPDKIKKAKENFANLDVNSQISLLEGDAADVLLVLMEKGETYDFIFMDAAKAQYIHFLPMVKKLLTEGGLLVSDNVLQDGSVIESKFTITRRDRTIHSRMREYLYAITHDDALTTVILPMGDGVSLSVKETKERTEKDAHA
ncbi:MAG: O-methyltransferase [Lachnospiraceae bacterium]|nr:O-methyltransferase [Lachnospiraceae bacterium]